MSRTHSEETNSTSVAEESLNISFENINYTVRDGFWPQRGRKTILKNLCGTFRAGELTVIMGQSGAGKSTLMDILSGYTKATSGNIRINDRLRNEKKFRRRSCYILQDCMVVDQLTIQESLAIATDLKLGNHISEEQKKLRIEQIITSLGLNSARHTRAGNLSGGQKKRLAIGLELVDDPPVILIDEPTSGLDSSISKHIVFLLHLLARQGRTVVVTMHQPCATILRMMDSLYAVESGRCVYAGALTQLPHYLKEMELTCPIYQNHVEYLLEISTDNADAMVEKCQNGRSGNKYNEEITINTDLIRQLNRTISEDITLTLLPPPKENPTNKILLALKSSYSTSVWKQFTTLIRRAALRTWRDPSLSLLIMGIHCAMALFVGLLFFNISYDAANVRDNYNILNFCLMFLMFTAFSGASISFPGQIPIVRREHFNRWYTTGAYFASCVTSLLPTQTMCTLTFACLVYWLTGQPHDLIRFFSFCFVLLLVSYVGAAKGLLIGFLFNVKNGVVFGPFFIMPFVVFSGFFLQYDHAPFFIQWLFNLSFLKHGLVGVVLSIYGMNRAHMNQCSELYCHYKYPETFLREFGFRKQDDNGVYRDEEYYVFVISILGIGCVVLTLAFLILKIRLKHKW